MSTGDTQSEKTAHGGMIQATSDNIPRKSQTSGQPLSGIQMKPNTESIVGRQSYNKKYVHIATICKRLEREEEKYQKQDIVNNEISFPRIIHTRPPELQFLKTAAPKRVRIAKKKCKTIRKAKACSQMETIEEEHLCKKKSQEQKIPLPKPILQELLYHEETSAPQEIKKNLPINKTEKEDKMVNTSETLDNKLSQQTPAQDRATNTLPKKTTGNNKAISDFCEKILDQMFSEEVMASIGSGVVPKSGIVTNGIDNISHKHPINHDDLTNEKKSDPFMLMIECLSNVHIPPDRALKKVSGPHEFVKKSVVQHGTESSKKILLSCFIMFLFLFLLLNLNERNKNHAKLFKKKNPTVHESSHLYQFTETQKALIRKYGNNTSHWNAVPTVDADESSISSLDTVSTQNNSMLSSLVTTESADVQKHFIG
ncbi:hypothetical protein RFI_07994 [Reticulomyxa filosa]|uniref:Uncharacterized protein n=1 Tax=Reticulomyxa filosa TaxID=46433 RepID=X6NTP1_RETFI|nr:hypothetical protein RFI_07994 [Reticulomyxa filosa]|eukprot:ETO29134.1 hypothetical protein RFI_07994 [Reticulomyxa filosa]